jgi:dynein heavy chain
MYFDLQTFSSEFLAKRSRAASAICDWMKNIVQYGDVVAEVEPGRLLLVEAEAQLQIHQEHLAEVHLRLSLLQEKLAIVTSEYETMDERYRAAKESYERSRVKLDLAQRLVSSLGEEERWTNEMPPLQRLIEAAVPDTLMAACFLTLCGPFSQKFRNTQIKSWSALMQEEGMSLKFQDPLKVLASPEKVAAWTIQGLPEDRFSKENAAIISNVESSQALFLFDPHDRCISWLKSTLASDEKGAEPIIVAQGASSMRSTLKSAMGEGRTLILQRTNRNVLPIIYPVLARATISRGGRTTCRLGEEDVDIHPNFRIILHSLLGTESYPPELQTTVRIPVPGDVFCIPC